MSPMRLFGMSFAAMAVLPFCLAQAQTLTTIYTFTGGNDGEQPAGGLIYKNGLFVWNDAGRWSGQCGYRFQAGSSDRY